MKTSHNASIHALCAGLLLCLSVAGCSSPPAQSEGESDRISQAELDRLKALGYVGFTHSQVREGEAVVSRHDRSRSVRGYNLISNRDLTSAQLFDMEGEIVRSWEDPGANHWSNAELLSDGSLLVTGSEEIDAEGSNFLLRMDWNGNVLWRAPIKAHHDAEQTPDGRIATLTFNFREIPAISEEHPVKDHNLSWLDAGGGELLDEFSIYEALASNPTEFTFQPVKPKTQEGESFIDLLHTNSLEFMHQPQLAERDPIYALGNVLISIRAQDTIAILDSRDRKLIWAWGQGEISGQHDARVLESGNILLFDNGVDQKRSRIVELDPLTKKIVWEYSAPIPEDFFSLRKGSSQRLAGGNTLIANSDSGDAFEVTAEGDVVWHFLNPNADEQGARATIVRIHRYPPAFIESLLSGGRQ
jgi:hypothetical protein